MEDRVEAAIVNFPVVSEFWIGANGWKTEPEWLRKPGRISGKQTEQVIFQRSRIWRLEDVSALRVLAAGTHVHCHLVAATLMNPRTLPPEKSLFIERRNLALS